jgi:hypothetical protein
MSNMHRDSDSAELTPPFGNGTSTQRVRRAAMLVPLVCVALYGCPTAETDDDAAGTPSGYEDVLYEGGTTDEALVSLAAALDQGAPQPDTSQAPLLVGPMGELPSDPAPTFTWKLGSSAGAPTRADDDLRWASSWPPDEQHWEWRSSLTLGEGRPRRAQRWWAGLLGVRSAHAHGDPFSGYGVLLTISSSSDPKLCRVFTGATSYSPSAEVWDKIVAAGEVTVALVGAAFENNRIPAGSGPYLGSTSTLTITSAPQ